MNDLVVLLAEQGLLLAAGATALLLAGAGCVSLTRSPVHRQRLAELTVLGVLVWMVLACLPMPRVFSSVVDLSWLWTADSSMREANIGEVQRASGGEPMPDQQQPGRLHHSELSQKELAEVESELAGLWAGPTPAQPIDGDTLSSNILATTTEDATVLPMTVTSVVAQSNVAQSDAAQSDAASWSSVVPARWLAVAYVAVASLCAVWLGAGYLVLLRVRRLAKRPPAWVVELFRSLLHAGTRPIPRLIESERCGRAVSWGALRPVILLPTSLCRRRSVDKENVQQLRSVLLHELGHVVQRDAWGNLLFCLAFPLLYWHPLYWLLRSQARLAAELVADDWAAQHTGKQAYVEQLVALAGSMTSGHVRLLGATGVVSSPSQFYRRMEMLLKRENQLATRPSKIWRVAALGGCGAIVMFAALLGGTRPTVAEAQDKPEEKLAIDPTSEGISFSPDTAKPNETSVTTAEVDANAKRTEQDELRDQLNRLEAEKHELRAQIEKLQYQLTQQDARHVTRGETDLAVAALGTELAAIKAKLEELRLERRELEGKEESSAQRDARRAELAKYESLANETAKRLEQLRTSQGSGKSQHLGVPGLKELPIVGRLFRKEDNAVVIARLDERGQARIERWTADENGEPQKLLETHELKQDKPIVGITMQDDDRTGAIIVEYRLKGGQRNLEIVQPKRPNPFAGDGPEPKQTNPTLKPWPAERRQSAQRADDLLSGLKISRELDLINLATSYADAVGAVELGGAKIDELRQRVSTGTATPGELRAEEAALAGAVRKQNLLRRIAEVATNSAAQEYERMRKLHDKRLVPSDAWHDAEGKMRILKEILNTEPSVDRGNPAGDTNKPAERPGKTDATDDPAGQPGKPGGSKGDILDSSPKKF